jgi:hypothetical protein
VGTKGVGAVGSGASDRYKKKIDVFPVCGVGRALGRLVVEFVERTTDKDTSKIKYYMIMIHIVWIVADVVGRGACDRIYNHIICLFCFFTFCQLG